MISIPAIYRAFGLTTPPAEPHYFQIERMGEIMLPENKNNPDDHASKFIHIIPLDASLSSDRIENIIRACQNSSTQQGPDIFVSINRAQNARFHIMSPSAKDESHGALKLLEKLAQHLTAPQYEE